MAILPVPNELLQAVGSEEILHRLELAFVARRLDRERIFLPTSTILARKTFAISIIS